MESGAWVWVAVGKWVEWVGGGGVAVCVSACVSVFDLEGKEDSADAVLCGHFHERSIC